MKSYKVEIGKKQLLGALSDHLSSKKGQPIVVKEKHSIDCVGYYEEKEVTVDIYYEERIDIYGQTAIKTTSLSEEDVKDIFVEIFKERGYDVSSFFYKKRIKARGDDFDYDETPVFEGVEIKITEHQKELKKK